MKRSNWMEGFLWTEQLRKDGIDMNLVAVDHYHTGSIDYWIRYHDGCLSIVRPSLRQFAYGVMDYLKYFNERLK